MPRVFAASLVSALALSACSRSETTPLVDGGSVDGGSADAGLSDVGAPDLGEAQDGAAPPDAAVEDAGGASPTFTTDVFPIFEAEGCTRVACHGSLRAQGGRALYLPDPITAFADMLGRRSVREPRAVVEPGQPDDSVLFTHGRDANLPAGDLTAEGLAVIEAWIRGGAPFGPDAIIPIRLPPETCSLADRPGTPPLPPACLPRCSADTWSAIIACRATRVPVACQARAISADPTPAVSLDFGPELGPLELTCGPCLDLQTETCLVELCRTEYLALIRCLDLGGRCTTEQADLDRCRTDGPSFRACQAERDEACVAF